MAKLTEVEILDLTGSTDGKPILVPDTAIASGSAVTVHTATATAGKHDVLKLQFHNADVGGAAQTIQLDVGGTVVAYATLPGDTRVDVPLGPLSGGVVVKAFNAGANNLTLISGVVYRNYNA